MTIHTRLADALRLAGVCEVEPTRDNWFGCTPEKAADALLSLPGIAIVELPEPQGNNTGETDFGLASYWHDPPGQPLDRSITTYNAPVLMRPETARQYAAALLAAADQEER